MLLLSKCFEPENFTCESNILLFLTAVSIDSVAGLEKTGLPSFSIKIWNKDPTNFLLQLIMKTFNVIN